jgi:predicted metal-dependent phosphoesterase TrpH
MLYDFHVHSKYSSDGIVNPEDIVKTAKNKGLSGVAITDHNTVKGGIEAKKFETDDFKVIIGSEIMTPYGEIMGLFINDDIKSREPLQVMEEIKDQGGIVVIPHPCDSIRKSSFTPKEEHVNLIDNIEIFNSRCINQKFNDNAQKIASKFELGSIAGSDAHFKNEIGNAGIKTNNDDIRTAILKNDFEIFGKISWLGYPILTKMLKIWRKRF